jgi:hypothetical protein
LSQALNQRIAGGGREHPIRAVGDQHQTPLEGLLEVVKQGVEHLVKQLASRIRHRGRSHGRGFAALTTHQQR